jgi:hypothetical protein
MKGLKDQAAKLKGDKKSPAKKPVEKPDEQLIPSSTITKPDEEDPYLSVEETEPEPEPEPAAVK